jgi:hypothetical protein
VKNKAVLILAKEGLWNLQSKFVIMHTLQHNRLERILQTLEAVFGYLPNRCSPLAKACKHRMTEPEFNFATKWRSAWRMGRVSVPLRHVVALSTTARHGSGHGSAGQKK